MWGPTVTSATWNERHCQLPPPHLFPSIYGFDTTIICFKGLFQKTEIPKTRFTSITGAGKTEVSLPFGGLQIFLVFKWLLHLVHKLYIKKTTAWYKYP